MTLSELIEILQTFPDQKARVRLWSTDNDGGRITAYPFGEPSREVIMNEPDQNGNSSWKFDE